MLATEENGKIFGGGMIKDRVENLNMIQLRQKTKCSTLIPRDQLFS